MAVVTTRVGDLRGSREGAVTVWRGIPYAAAPVGPLRFRAPRPLAPWAGIREAVRFGAAAPQPPSLAERVLGLDGHGPMSEDCLFLNVWSPGPGGPARPVMVWLHGGSFLTGAGSDPLYDGTRLAARGDVVVVTLNYRLGPLGFLHLSDPRNGDADRNIGLQDQIAALAWVRDNIAGFGGDPERVTLFGQSAGAMASGALLGVPAVSGLFHQAILQSGAAGHVHDRAAADRIARTFLKALGLRTADMAVLRALPVEALVAASRSVTTGVNLTGLPFQPVVDGVVLPERPLVAIRAGARAGMPLLIGTTRNEMGLYAVMAEKDPASAALMRWRRLRALAPLAAALGPRRILRLAAVYRGAGGGALGFAGDLVFRQPALDLADAQAAHARVFMYRFDWPSPGHGGCLGACHATDLPFTWNALDNPAAATIARDGPAERALAETMQEAWIAFARTGQPAAPALSPWPPYEASTRATMILDRDCRIETDPRRAQRLAWQ